MGVLVAKSAGFCFGVSRAMKMVEEAAKEGKRVFTLGPIIHNRHAVSHLEQLGVKVINDPEEAVVGSTVVIRSHGVTRAVYEALQDRGVEIIDATCPFVKRIHNIVSDGEKEGRLPIIIGTRSHPEVEGIAGWCEKSHIFENAQELENWTKTMPGSENLPICMVCQTTSTESLWNSCVNFVKKQFTNAKIFDTICKATESRQSEAAQLSKNCQAMVVVGDIHSSNTGRLAMICR